MKFTIQFMLRIIMKCTVGTIRNAFSYALHVFIVHVDALPAFLQVRRGN